MSIRILKLLEDKVGSGNYLLKDNKLFLKQVDGDIINSLAQICKVEKILFLFRTSPQRSQGFEFMIYVKI